MTAFNPSMIVAATKSSEFATDGDNKRTAKAILIEGIGRQIELFKDLKKDGRRWFTMGQNEVALTLRVNNKPLPIIGTETKVVVPVAHFEAAMKHYEAEIKAGKFDAALAEADKGIAARREKMTATRKANKK